MVTHRTKYSVSIITVTTWLLSLCSSYIINMCVCVCIWFCIFRKLQVANIRLGVYNVTIEAPKESEMQYLDAVSESTESSVHFQGKPFNITVIQLYASTSNDAENEVEQFQEDLQDLLELTPKKDVVFIIGDWNAEVGSQEILRVTGKFGLGAQNEAGQRLIEF